MTKQTAKATAGERIAAGVSAYCEGTGLFVAGKGNELALARRIDSAIRRAVKAKEVECCARKQQKPGTRAGVSETVIEMVTEKTDPAMWATLQLTKPGQTTPATVGEAHDRIAAIFRHALAMAIKHSESDTTPTQIDAEIRRLQDRIDELMAMQTNLPGDTGGGQMATGMHGDQA